MAKAARRPALNARAKVKKPRVTRSEAYLVNLKYMGDEPELRGQLSDSQLGKALNWYNAMCSTSEYKEYTRDYLKSLKRDREAKQVMRVPDQYFPTTIGSISRLLSRGCTVQDSTMSFFESKLKEALSRVIEIEKPETPVEKVSIQDRMKERANDIIGDIEEIIDSGVEFSLYDHLQKNQIPAMYATKIIDHYRPWLEELCEAHEGKCDQLKEAYKHLTKKQLEARVLFINSLIEDAERYGDVTKKLRAPRKPRAVSAEKKLKNFIYMKESNEYKIASISPDKVLGAQELWTFNTKYKLLTVFRARGPAGLDVKRTTIIGYDESTTMTKRCGRKPEYFVDKVLNGGKLVLRKLMDEAKGDAPLAARINEHTILLKVVS